MSAKNAIGEGAVSSASTAFIAAVIPTEPVNLAKQSSTRDSITIQWDAPTDSGGTPITVYKIYGNSGGSDTSF